MQLVVEVAKLLTHFVRISAWIPGVKKGDFIRDENEGGLGFLRNTIVDFYILEKGADEQGDGKTKIKR